MKVLLLGGTGTLSRAVLEEALLNNIKVSILNRGLHNNHLSKEVHVIKGDFYAPSKWRDSVVKENYDVVVDFLSRTSDDIERVYPIIKDCCKQYVFISSACVYRRSKEDFPIKEISPKPNMNWSYNTEKYESELKLRELAANAKSYFTIVRPYITYNDERIPIGIAPAYKYHRMLVERIKAGKPWFVWDDGSAITTVTYVADFAVGLVGLFLNEKAKNEDFHITGDFSYTQNQLVEKLFLKLNVPINVVHIPASDIASILPEYKGLLLGDRALDASFDNSKIKAAVPQLCFKTSLDQGLDYILANLVKSKPQYDYIFEARIDKLISKYKKGISFVCYPEANKKSHLIYLLFRYFPYKIALRLKKCL